MRKLLFFHASWCSPCRFYEKQFIAPLEERAGAEHIEHIDAWKEPWKAEKYMVGRLPTVVFLDGETVHMIRTGSINIEKVSEWLKGESDND